MLHVYIRHLPVSMNRLITGLRDWTILILTRYFCQFLMYHVRIKQDAEVDVDNMRTYFTLMVETRCWCALFGRGLRVGAIATTPRGTDQRPRDRPCSLPNAR